MSKTKLHLVANQQAKVIQFESVKPVRYENLTVTRCELTQVLRDANYISNTLHNVENLDDPDWQDITDLCRTACRIVNSVNAIIDRKGGSIK